MATGAEGIGASWPGRAKCDNYRVPFPRNQSAAASWMQDAAQGAARGAVRGAGDVAAMLRGITVDPRVSQAAKVEAAAALAYLLSGRGRVPGFIPGVGRLDGLAVGAFMLRRLLAAAGEPVLRAHWRGSPRGLEVVLTMTGALAAPRGRLRRLAVASAAASVVRDQFAGGAVASGRRSGSARVIEGEIVARREDGN